VAVFAILSPALGGGISFPADAGVRNVKSEFGAKGDGITDDTAAIQKAFDSGKSTVYFPHGTYILRKPITILGKGKMIHWCGSPLLFQYPQQVWLRGLNCKSHTGPKIDNRAADLWIMGYKAEGTGTGLLNGQAARTELLGGILHPAGGDIEKNPSFIYDGGRLSRVHAMFWTNRQYIHDT